MYSILFIKSNALRIYTIHTARAYIHTQTHSLLFCSILFRIFSLSHNSCVISFITFSVIMRLFKQLHNRQIFTFFSVWSRKTVLNCWSRNSFLSLFLKSLNKQKTIHFTRRQKKIYKVIKCARNDQLIVVAGGLQ